MYTDSGLAILTSWVTSELCWDYGFLWCLLDCWLNQDTVMGPTLLFPFGCSGTVPLVQGCCLNLPRCLASTSPSFPETSTLTCSLTRSFPSPCVWRVLLLQVKQKKELFTWDKRVENQEFSNVPCSNHCQETFQDVGAKQLKTFTSGLLKGKPPK